MKDKVLVSFSSYNAPHFLEHLVESFSRYDAGYPYDLLILDNSSTDPRQIKLLEKYSKIHRVEIKPNYGRAQGGYDYAWQKNKDYRYYFFMHDDSSIIRDNWLKVAVDRIEDSSLEKCLEDSKDACNCQMYDLPIGKVGFQAYEWGDRKKYLRTGYQQIFNYMEPLASIMNVEIPWNYQHINDDRYLIKNGLLQSMQKIWNIEEWKQLELKNDLQWKQIDEWYSEHLPNRDPFPPNDRYGWRYHAFQTVSEFLSDIAPMRYGYRTHCVLGDGYCQEELGWSRFWGLEYVNHYGSHNLFKRLSLLFKVDEQEIRNRFKDKTFLNICDNIVKKETSYVER